MEVTDRCLELAEQAFRAPAVDVYVTNEFGVAAWSCPVRRDLLHVNDEVQGRTAHVIRRPDGALITTPVITHLFGRAQAYEWVRRFQVREEPGHRLRLLLEARRPPSEAQRHTLIRTIQSGVGPDFQVDLEIVDQIPVAPNGKLQLLVPWSSGSGEPTPASGQEEGPTR